MIPLDLTALAKQPVPWLDSPGDSGGVAVSSRVRFARNLRDTPYPRSLDRTAQHMLVERVAGACEAVIGPRFHLVHKLSETGRKLLAERQLVSRDLASARRPTGLAIDASERIVVMVNEEDHLRLQSFAPGLLLEECLTRAVTLDERLAELLPWAIDPTLGHLTACHTNVGTGMRASVMLHLPALAETGQIKPVFAGLAKLHLAVRGHHGEGTEPSGHLYQISNHRTLGLDELGFVELVTDAARTAIAAEHQARDALLSRHRLRTEDKIHRAAGLLTHARTLSSEELIEQLGWIRLGLALSALPSDCRPDWPTLDRLLVSAMPAHLELLEAGATEPTERDRIRADRVRAVLRGGSAGNSTTLPPNQHN